MKWLSRLTKLFFIEFSYEPVVKTVVITLRLNAYFIQGAVITALVLTLVLRYGGVSFGSAGELIRDLWSGVWLWFALASVLVLLAAGIRKAKAAGGEGPRVPRIVPQGVRGTALLCLALLVLLAVLTWGASSPKPSHQARSEGEETPSIWRSIRKGEPP